MAYDIVVKPLAKKVLDTLPKADRARMIQALERLADDPRHPGVIKLETDMPLYRVRIGDCRAVFSIEDERLCVAVVKIGHRREVYR
jgi:mRNA interferase RelE/StbE